MRSYWLATAMLVFVSIGYSQRSQAVPCSNYSNYGQLLFTACTIDDKVFGGFDYSAESTGGATLVFLGDITFTVIQGGVNDGFHFTFPLSAGPGQTNDLMLSYSVLCLLGDDCMTSVDMSIVGSVSAGGSATAGQTTCFREAGAICAPPFGTPGPTLSVSYPGHPIDSASFSGVPFLGINEDIRANCTSGCTATVSISDFTDTVDQHAAPEPASLALFGAGMACLALFRRRKVS